MDNYILAPSLEFAFRALDGARQSVSARGMQVALLEGPPGCGKTSAAERFAAERGFTLVYWLLHAASDDQELFAGIDVAAAVAGDAARVRLPGVLARAAEASQAGPTVLVLDEIDKVSERTEYLLLDFLQTGRVPLAPGLQMQARQEHLTVFLTSNAARPLGDALLRRCRRVVLPGMSRETLKGLLVGGGTPQGVAHHVVRLGLAAARAGGYTATVQEMRHLVEDLSRCQSLAEVQIACEQWLTRDAASRAALGALDSLWGELRASRVSP